MTKKLKRKHNETENEAVTLPAIRHSDESSGKKTKWINRQRVLVFASRGINHRDRHLMEDIKKLMPHHRPEPKMERSKTLSVINEMCEMKNCTKAMMFEGRKKQDLYIWLSNIPNGPSAKFLVENVYTMAELKLTGNCLRGSRPLLSFDPTFVEKPHYTLLKEIFTQIFGVPKQHPKSQPFFDHVYTFTILDNRIWFRNFQILSEDGALAEVGPRFVLNPVKIFSGSFGGIVLWENPSYISPAKYRMQIRITAKNKYLNRVQQKVRAEATRPGNSDELPLEDIFQGDPLEKAREIEKRLEKEKDSINEPPKKKRKMDKKFRSRNESEKNKQNIRQVKKTQSKPQKNTNSLNEHIKEGRYQPLKKKIKTALSSKAKIPTKSAIKSKIKTRKNKHVPVVKKKTKQKSKRLET